MAKAKKKAGRRDLPFDEFVKWPPELTVLTDQPLTPEQTEAAFEADTFGFRYKLGPLYDILRSAETKTPMAVLITGDWGTGKTSAMRWIEGLLQKWNKAGPKDRIKVRPVWFYPWKYDNKEDVRRGLIAEVIIKSIDVENISTKTVISAAKKFGMFLGKSFIHALASIKLKGQVSADAGAAKAEAGAEVDLASIKEILSEYQQAAHPEKAFLNEFETTLKDWVQDTIGKDGKERMVIFIDDLDRCMPDIALQVLEALKLYLNIPNLVFVLGVDRDVVEKLVVEHYRKLGLIRTEQRGKDKTQTEEEKAKSEQDKTRRQQDEDKAKLYLSKMFQIEIELSTKEEQIRKFFDESLAKMPLWQKKLLPEHQELFRGLVLNLAERNPREVKRILNSAFMSGAGAEMIKVKNGKEPPGFQQDLQDFFIRRILRKPQYERIVDVIDTDEGRRFFSVWSKVACKGFAASLEKLDDVLPDYVLTKRRSEKEDESMARGKTVTLSSSSSSPSSSSSSIYSFKSSSISSSSRSTSEEGPSIRELLYNEIADEALYEKYELLLSDKDLWALMLVEFSPELAERTQEVSVADKLTVQDNVQVQIVSKDERRIREGIASMLGKAPFELTEADYKNVTELDLSRASIVNIEFLAKLKNLQWLNLTDTKVSDIGPLKDLTNLRLLDLHGVPVSDISVVANLKELRSLNLYDTDVSDINAVGNLVNLKGLGLNGTKVTDIGVLSHLTNLQRLNLDRTEIRDISVVSSLSNLRRLGLDHVEISDISVLSDLVNLQYLGLNEVSEVSNLEPLKKLTGLQELLLNGTSVSDLEPLRDLTGLLRLGVNRTHITNIVPLKNLIHLIALDLNETKVSDFDLLKNLTSLRRLYLSDTGITDIGVLSGLTNLQRLELSSTQVSDISVIADLTKLQRLDISGTKVSDINALGSLKNLQWLNLRDTKVTDEQLAELKKVLPKLDYVR